MNRKIALIFPFALALTGCATGGTPAVPVIIDLESDKVKVQAVTDIITPPPTRESLDAVANEGCGLHGRKAKSLSYSCRLRDPTNSFSGQICEYLYACLTDDSSQ